MTVTCLQNHFRGLFRFPIIKEVKYFIGWKKTFGFIGEGME
jgi:hypothetical protein